MKHYFNILFITLATIPFVEAQYSTGALRNNINLRNAENAMRKMMNNTRAMTAPAELLPQSSSLRPYCPTAGNQCQTPSCIVWATVHGALTTQLAKQRNILDKNRIDALTFSVGHIFNQVSPKCEPIGLSAMIPALRSGVILEALYPNEFCRKTNITPSYSDFFSVSHFEPLLLPEFSFDTSLLLIKRELKQGYPVVIQVKSLPSLKHPEQGYWKPSLEEKEDSITDHALCLVGYDDKTRTFELLNSWGSTWGDMGFVRISYQNLLDAALDLQEKGILRAAYKVRLNSEIRYSPFKPVLQQLIAQQLPCKEAHFESIKVETNTHFHVLKKDFCKSDRMRFLLPIASTNACLYILGRDAGTKRWAIYAQKQFQQKELGILPNESELFNFTSAGKEILVCALSEVRINEADVEHFLNELPTIDNYQKLHQLIEKFFKARNGELQTFVLNIL